MIVNYNCNTVPGSVCVVSSDATVVVLHTATNLYLLLIWRLGPELFNERVLLLHLELKFAKLLFFFLHLLLPRLQILFQMGNLHMGF